MSLFFPPILSLPAPQKPPATITQTLEKALTDAFIQALPKYALIPCAISLQAFR